VLRTLVQSLALLLTLGASVLLVRGNLGMGLSAIVELSTTKIGYSLDVARSLATQQADSRVGVALLLLSAVLQGANLLWPMRISDFRVSGSGFFFAVGAFGFIMGFAWLISQHLATMTYEQAKRSHEARAPGGAG